MLYVDVGDVCRAFEIYVRKILDGEIGGDGLSNVVNLCWPEPNTILELAGMARDSIIKYSGGGLSLRLMLLIGGSRYGLRLRIRD